MNILSNISSYKIFSKMLFVKHQEKWGCYQTSVIYVLEFMIITLVKLYFWKTLMLNIKVVLRELTKSMSLLHVLGRILNLLFNSKGKHQNVYVDMLKRIIISNLHLKTQIIYLGELVTWCERYLCEVINL